MVNNFEEIDLDNEKIKKIVSCGFKVFTTNDLEKASTNTIVKMAGISRGILYHYFNDKQALFDFLIYFSVQKSLIEMNKTIHWEDGDIIERFKGITLDRIKLMQQYPGLLEFVEKYRFMMMDYMVTYGVADLRERMYEENMDRSLFLHQDEVKEAIKVAYWTFGGVLRQFNEQLERGDESLDEAIEACEHYAIFLKRTLYLN